MSPETRKTRKNRKTQAKTKKNNPRHQEKLGKVRGLGEPHPRPGDGCLICLGFRFSFVDFLVLGLHIPPSIPQPGVWLLSPSNFSWFFFVPRAIFPGFCFSFHAFPGFPGFRWSRPQPISRLSKGMLYRRMAGSALSQSPFLESR